MQKNRKIIVIGALAAGMAFAARMRRLDETSEIIIFDKGEQASVAVCKFPYFLEDLVLEEELSKFSPQAFKALFNIEIRLNSELIKIDHHHKLVAIKDLKTNLITNYSYDKLVLATGTTPKKINDFTSDKLSYVKTISDIKNIKSKLTNSKKIIIIGGGVIALEIIEALISKKYDITLIEKNDFILDYLDREISISLENYLLELGVSLYKGVKEINFNEDFISFSAKELKYDQIIVAAGNEYPLDYLANLAINLDQKGLIKVNNNYQIGLKDIYAIGDVATKNDLLKNKIAFCNAQAAAIQGRELANILNKKGTYKNLTTSPVIFKIVENSVAYLGRPQKDDNLITVHTSMDELGETNGLIKFYFNPKNYQISAMQVFGNGNNLALINTLSIFMQLKNDVRVLNNISLAYAPPYDLSKGVLNIIGAIANNMINKVHNRSYYEKISKDEIILDVRTHEEQAVNKLDNAICIPLALLRSSLGLIDKNKIINILCHTGKRAYIAERILKANGYHASVIDGGIKSILLKEQNNGI